MAFRKYQKAEKSEVVAAADAPDTLRKFGVVEDAENIDTTTEEETQNA